MRFINLYGKQVFKNIQKNRMNWDCAERSKPQFLVKKFLEKYWKNHVVYREMPVVGTLLKIDIYNATLKIAVEIDGVGVHDAFNKHFHKNRIGYLNSIKRDCKKEKFCEMNNINLIRIMSDEVDDLSPKFFKEKFDIVL